MMIFQKGRLRKLNGEPLAQPPIEHRIACYVYGIGEDNRMPCPVSFGGR